MAEVVIGKDIETGETVTIADLDRRAGIYMLGLTGMGKSTLLINLQKQDIEHGHGLFFLDPHGTAILDLLSVADSSRLKNHTLLLDPDDETHTFGINLFYCKDVSS